MELTKLTVKEKAEFLKAEYEELEMMRLEKVEEAIKICDAAVAEGYAEHLMPITCGYIADLPGDEIERLASIFGIRDWDICTAERNGFSDEWSYAAFLISLKVDQVAELYI